MVEPPNTVIAPPAPPPADVAATMGQRLQRSMALMAESTPRQRRTVRVLFYGQSITAQPWWQQVAADLRQRFPHADLVIENRAIGGFSAQRLIRTADADLYPFYPDLLIFHVYGDHRRYEEIIARTRSRTTAEIALCTDHVNARSHQPDGTIVDTRWTRFMADWQRRVAEKYHCELVPIRSAWKRYLREHDLHASELLKDNVHLNERGMALMAQLVARQLQHRPDLPPDPWSTGVVHEHAVTAGDWRDGRLKLEVTGNRIDLLASPASTGSSPAVRVRIDGQPPSAFPELYHHSRPNDRQTADWPWTAWSMMRVGHDAPLLVENWTLRVTEAGQNIDDFRFEVIGSRTGHDGEGSSMQRFVSHSRRVVIEPDDWFINEAAQLAERRGREMPPLQPGYEIAWHVVSLGTDRWQPPRVEDPSREHTATVAQGLENTKHVLELIVDGEGAEPPAIAAVRVYEPPLKANELMWSSR